MKCCFWRAEFLRLGSLCLTDNLTDGIFESGLIGCGEGAELADDEVLLQRGENRLDGGGFQQPGRLPVPQPDLAQCRAGAELAGDGHQQGWVQRSETHHIRHPIRGRGPIATKTTLSHYQNIRPTNYYE